MIENNIEVTRHWQVVFSNHWGRKSRSEKITVIVDLSVMATPIKNIVLESLYIIAIKSDPTICGVTRGASNVKKGSAALEPGSVKSFYGLFDDFGLADFSQALPA